MENSGCKNCKHYYNSTDSVFPVGDLYYCTNKNLIPNDCGGFLLSEDFSPNKKNDCVEFEKAGFWGRIANNWLEAM